MKRKIAVVGAGFAGLAVCWHLLQYPAIEVTLFDPAGIGGGASGVSTGLLHPFPGRLALRSWLSTQGMQASLELINSAEKALNHSVALRTGIFRIAVQPIQKKAFFQRAQEDPEALWIENVQDKICGAIQAPGLWIPSGITVFSKLYLEGLWASCVVKGASFKKERIESLGQLSDFDQSILAVGDKSMQFSECSQFDIQLVKGQTLICQTQKTVPSSLIGIGHMTATEYPNVCQIGSTYEHGYDNADPHPEVANELLGKIALFYPEAATYEVMQIKAGIRIAPKTGYRPLAVKIASTSWALTGLGSRGLLYHALFAKKMAEAVVFNSNSLSVGDLHKPLKVSSL